jgi:transposase
MVLMDAQWTVLAPLIEACRPHRKTQHHHLRRPMEAMIWRCQNGAKWRAIPAEYGPWWMAAQTFIRWNRHGVWERLLRLAQEKGVRLGMVFLDGSNIRAHQKPDGTAKKGDLEPDAIGVRLLADHVVAMDQGPCVRRRRWPCRRLQPSITVA